MIGDVGRDRHRAAARLFDAGLDRSEPIGTTRHQRHRGTFPRQQLGEAQAESARRAGDERDAALDVEELRCSHRTSPGQTLVSWGV